MLARPPQRTSLCLLCAFAASRSRSRVQRLLPHVQVAYRTDTRKPISPTSKHGSFGYDIGNRPERRESPRFRMRKEPMSHTVYKLLERLQADLSQPEFLESLQMTPESFDIEWATFERDILRSIKNATTDLPDYIEDARRSKRTLQSRLRHLFYAQVYGGRFTKAELDNQKKMADLRYPSEWYPATREIPRTVHLHVGPTNSGKTYHALKRLEAADKGIYLGPLRLLAHEVYTRLNATGKPCALVTGEEQRVPEGETKMWSCTVEMAPLNTELDVAVLDEIQMIAHPDRGWAWTQAFLGIKAKELHLCGEARTVPLIRELCALVGDKVHIHEYKRLTQLQLAPRSLRGKLNNLQKGDCIVAFSVLGIHALRKEVEKKSGRKCAIVYGSLPPETRAQQARLFNDPDNDYDFMVASDAIGMGLNLAIRRVILESTMKSDGSRLVPLQVSEIKQIAGRAGRYKTAHEATSQAKPQQADLTTSPGDAETNGTSAKAEPERPVGIVTTLEQLDYPNLEAGMALEPEPIPTAGLFPPSLIVERFANYFPPGTPLSYILIRLNEISTIHSRFHLCALRDQLQIADEIHTIKDLSISDRITICAAPINPKSEDERIFLRSMAACIADGNSGNLLDVEGLPLERLDEPPSDKRDYLYKLEELHKMVVAYLWLSYRFPHVFTTRPLANHAKQLVEEAIERTLAQFSWTQQARDRLREKRAKAIRELETQQKHHPIEGQGSEGSSTHLLQEMRDVLQDERSFADEAPPADDVGEYPTEELDVLEPSETERLQKLGEEIPGHTQQMSKQAHDSLSSSAV